MSNIVTDTSSKNQVVSIFLAWPSCILAFVSLLCNLYVCREARYKIRGIQKTHKQQPNDIIVFKLIAGLTLSGSTYSILWMIEQFPALLCTLPHEFCHHHHYDALTCKIVGICTQISATLDPLWHSLIAFSLAYLICNNNILFLQNKAKWYIAIIIIVAAGLSVVPRMSDYGGFYNYKRYMILISIVFYFLNEHCVVCV